LVCQFTEENKLRVFENGVLKKIFGAKRGQVTEERRTFGG
jgi:hypothetical protein